VGAADTSHAVTGEDELRQAPRDRLVSRREVARARRELAELTAVVGAGRLAARLGEVCPFGPAPAPSASGHETCPGALAARAADASDLVRARPAADPCLARIAARCSPMLRCSAPPMQGG
jgi:hypothetical protein